MPSLKILILSTFLMSCQASEIRITYKGNATVEIVEPNNLNAKGKVLPKSPILLDSELLVNKAIKFSRGKAKPLYWYFLSNEAGITKLSIDLDDPSIFGIEQAKETKSNNNFTHRLLLSSYHALSLNDYELARKLSDTISSVDPTLAAPYIIKSLSYLREGNKNLARTALARANELDPDDGNIKRLMESEGFSL